MNASIPSTPLLMDAMLTITAKTRGREHPNQPLSFVAEVGTRSGKSIKFEPFQLQKLETPSSLTVESSVEKGKLVCEEKEGRVALFIWARFRIADYSFYPARSSQQTYRHVRVLCHLAAMSHDDVNKTAL